MENDKESLLWKLTAGNKEDVNGKIVFDALRAGDKTAERVVKKHGISCGGGNERNQRIPSASNRIIIDNNQAKSDITEQNLIIMFKKLLDNEFVKCYHRYTERTLGN